LPQPPSAGITGIHYLTCFIAWNPCCLSQHFLEMVGLHVVHLLLRKSPTYVSVAMQSTSTSASS
jgi:hypothetical protein